MADRRENRSSGPCGTVRRLLACRSGTAAIEFAIIGPCFLVLTLGIVSYGGYFWLSHSIQQLTNDAARAALSGMTASERQAIARNAVAQNLPRYAYLSLPRAQLEIEESGQALTISLAYDASDTPFWSMKGLVPLPSETIRRTATIRLGGY